MAGSSANSRPAAGSSSSQRAVRMRRTCPCAKSRDVAVGGTQLAEHAVDPSADLLDRLPVGHAVVPERPAGPLLTDLRRRPALVGAVVPLHQLVARLRPVREAGKPASLERASERARQDEREVAALERGADSLGLLAAVLGQRHVRSPRVPAGPRPLRLAVTDEHDLMRDGMRRAAQPREQVRAARLRSIRASTRSSARGRARGRGDTDRSRSLRRRGREPCRRRAARRLRRCP